MRILIVTVALVASTAYAEPYKRRAAVPTSPTKADKPTAKPAAQPQPTVSMADAILAGEERAQPIRTEPKKRARAALKANAH